eukprot:CAMPEP_0176448896 /NCGR_PEP_ID=MMETSP0127-20121128/26109_1 /TAXON_ID=938130 /ORGANISM="Platyophrya macrostoma, Strain WH" /LENGTH=65 /DNA_ID=CAMNT_0017836039 /DNA_START=50 /DNA_END=244 /DNA_ORIENTATION=-
MTLRTLSFSEVSTSATCNNNPGSPNIMVNTAEPITARVSVKKHRFANCRMVRGAPSESMVVTREK